MRLEFTVPVPVSANHGNKNSAVHNRRYKTKEAIAFQNAVAEQAFMAKQIAPDWTPTKDTRLGLKLVIYFPDLRRRDIGNCEKLTSDAIKDVLGFDDCQIDDMRLQRYPLDKKNPHQPRCEVVVWDLPPGWCPRPED